MEDGLAFGPAGLPLLGDDGAELTAIHSAPPSPKIRRWPNP
jgi:hypothetical protein